MNYIFFIHSLEGQLGCFHFMATKNKSTLNLVEQVYLLEGEASFAYMSRRGKDGFKLELFPNFRENEKLIFRMEWLYKVVLL